MLISIASLIRKIAADVEYTLTKVLNPFLAELRQTDPHSKIPTKELLEKFFKIVDEVTGHGLDEDKAAEIKEEAKSITNPHKLLIYISNLALAGTKPSGGKRTLKVYEEAV